MGSIFYVENANSRLTVSDVNVAEVRLLGAYNAQTSRNFNVLIGTDSSTATIDTVKVADCDGVDVSLQSLHEHQDCYIRTQRS